MHATQDDEKIILLNDKHQPIGEAPKLASHHANTPLHLAFSCYIFNSQNQLLITQRAKTKKVWPGVWTNSVCGHPAPNERFEDAIRRRVADELGGEVSNIMCILEDYQYKTPPFNGIIEHEFCPVYTATLRGELAINPKEVADYAWVTIDELRQRIAEDPAVYSYWVKDQQRYLNFA
jgi:isopentenyl-diphosphate Delta-isomerase